MRTFDEDAAYDRAVDDAMLAVLEKEHDAREVGLAVAEVANRAWGAAARRAGLTMALDSGVVQEELGERLIDELRRSGWRLVRDGAA